MPTNIGIIRPKWKGPGGGPTLTSTVTHGSTSSSKQSVAERATGLTSYGFSFLNLAASVTVQATRDVAAAATAIGVRMPYAGSIIAMSFESLDTKTVGGSATFSAYVAGVASGATAVWADNLTGDVVTFPAGTYVFNARDLLTVWCATSAFAPTTVDVDLLVYVSFA